MLSASNPPAAIPSVYPDRLYEDSVLVVSPDRARREELAGLASEAGWVATSVGSTQEAGWELWPVLPHLVVIDVPVTENAGWALELIDRIRERPGGESVPVVVLALKRSPRFAVAAFGRRADDVVSATPPADELVARLRARIERRPVPRDELVHDPITGALTPTSFAGQIEHELERVERGGRAGVLALLQLDELPELEARHGRRARDEILAQVVALI